MNPTIRESEEITVKPAAPSDLKPGDIVLYQYEDRVIAHRLIARKNFDPQSSILESLSGSVLRALCSTLSTLYTPSSILDPRFSFFSTQSSSLSPQYFFLLRGDASLSFDKPVRPDQILGKVIAVNRYDRNIDPNTRWATIRRISRLYTSYIRRGIRYAIAG